MRFWHTFHDAVVVGARAAERGTWGPYEVGVLAIALVEAEEALKADGKALMDKRAVRTLRWAEGATPIEFGEWAREHFKGRRLPDRIAAEELAEELIADAEAEAEVEDEAVYKELPWWERLPDVEPESER